MRNYIKRSAAVALAGVMTVTLAGNVRADEAMTFEEARQASYDTVPDTNNIQGWPQGPNVYGNSAIVMDMNSGAILYGKKIDDQHYPASITKLLTALVALENSELDDEVYFSEDSVSFLEPGDASIGMTPGEILSMNDALYGMLLASANEVSYAIAESTGKLMGGDYNTFIQAMNDRAVELGCTGSHWTNANGLHNEQHYTTAHDMALIAQAAYSHPLFSQICQTQTYVIPKTNMCGEERWLNNHHKMLPEGAYAYDGCTGGKTGFTQAALNTLVTFAERDGRRLVCVSLRTNGPQIYADTAAMLDYGFQNFQNVTVYSPASCAAAHFLYPSLYFGQACTPDRLRSACTVTVPLNTDLSQLTSTVSQEEHQLTKAYQFSGYTVGTEQLSTDAIKTLLTSSPREAGISSGTYSASLLSQISEAPAVQNTASLLQSVPPVAYLLAVLLVALIIMELVLAARRKRRKKRKRKK